MFRCRQVIVSIAVSLLLGAPALAETLRCQSINGNLNCAGSHGVSCQTINGKTVCTSGHGDIVQSFGGAPPQGDDADMDVDPDRDDMPAPKSRIEQRGPSGHRILLERNGSQMRLHTDWLAVERN
jgi:hypothetical protein